MTHTTNLPDETKQLAIKLAQKLKTGGVVALRGELGAGKTTFTQGFAQGLGIKDSVTSPTFILIRSYPIPGKTKGKFFHIDLYRLEDPKQIDGLGLDEVFANPNNIVLIEWAEKLGEQLPSQATKIDLKIISETQREIEVYNHFADCRRSRLQDSADKSLAKCL